MTNYTYEEKQISIKVLEDLLEKEVECILNGCYLETVPSRLLHEKIKELKTVTFGDIKNQAGVKFMVGTRHYVMGIDVEYGVYYPIDLKIFAILDSKDIADDTQIEVINETETD